MIDGNRFIAEKVLLFLLLLFFEPCYAFYRCDGSPELAMLPKKSNQNKFMLRLSGNPQMYAPNEKYSVSIVNTGASYKTDKFIGFALTVEASDRNGGEVPDNVGTFQLYGDALIKFSDICPHMVLQAASSPRAEVNVHWTAPPPGTGCVIFRATVIEQRDLWYMHDGLLSRTICEDVLENYDDQPDVLDHCCACHEAKYEVTFEGLWSRHTHPRDFPPNSWLTRFSDVIGASHTNDYRFWDYGQIATQGLRDVAEHGRTRLLESELKAKSDNIRTIIKARGISYPNVTGKTFAVFRVDRKHHLMSLVSMIVPSPDWIVGVSGLELCLRNCSWVEFKVLNLKPWDVGTDSGKTYTSQDEPTDPWEPIRRITSKYPPTDENPFYESSGEDMKPLARLYITRQRLYEKSCDDEGISRDEDETAFATECAVTEWGPWSECSPNCGRGLRYKHRYYINQGAQANPACARDMYIKETCHSPRKCSEGEFISGSSGEKAKDEKCAVGEWEAWSSCSATCGNAVMTRSRKYLWHGGLKLCGGLPGAEELQQTIPCNLEDCEGEQPFEEDENCPVNWSDWTACSVTCGQGLKRRSTYPSTGSSNSCIYEEKSQEVSCNADLPSCEFSGSQAKDVCNLPVNKGRCKNKFERFYFDPEAATCKGFEYSGCKGNANNFMTMEECNTSCFPLVGDLKLNQTRQMAKYGVKLSAVIAYHIPVANEFGTANPDCDPVESTEPPFNINGFESRNRIIEYGIPIEAFTRPSLEDVTRSEIRVDCKVTGWSKRSHCSVTCGEGVKIRHRRIKTNPQNGGKPCPELTDTKPCHKRKCNTYTGNEEEDMSNASKEQNPTWGGPNPPGDENNVGRCSMTSWSAWSPCSATCGIAASQMRTRNVISSNGQPCEDRVQTRSCNFLPCKT